MGRGVQSGSGWQECIVRGGRNEELLSLNMGNPGNIVVLNFTNTLIGSHILKRWLCVRNHHIFHDNILIIADIISTCYVQLYINWRDQLLTPLPVYFVVAGNLFCCLDSVLLEGNELSFLEIRLGTDLRMLAFFLPIQKCQWRTFM